MMIFQDVWTWLVVVALLTALIPGFAAGIVGRSRRWSMERTRRIAVWLAVGLSISWWGLAVYGLHLSFPYDWIGVTIGTPVRVLAFIAWCLSPRQFAPIVAEKVYTLKPRDEPISAPDRS
jgi:hypothetical protein